MKSVKCNITQDRVLKTLGWGTNRSVRGADTVLVTLGGPRAGAVIGGTTVPLVRSIRTVDDVVTQQGMVHTLSTTTLVKLVGALQLVTYSKTTDWSTHSPLPQLVGALHLAKYKCNHNPLCKLTSGLVTVVLTVLLSITPPGCRDTLGLRDTAPLELPTLHWRHLTVLKFTQNLEMG